MDIFNDTKFKKAALGVLGILTLFLGIQTVAGIQTVWNSKYEKPIMNTITVVGKGEAVAIPDIATFSFTVTKEAESAPEAQKLVTDATNKIIEAVKKEGVEDKDIKTTNYNLYPKYDYPQVACFAYPCPPTKEVFRGYEVSQTLEVKVRNTEKVGAVVGAVTATGVTNVYGPSFAVDKTDDVIAEARNEAIKNAKAKAESIAEGLDVRLVRIVNFNENEEMMGPYGYGGDIRMTAMEGKAEVASVPSVPKGESKYTRTVYITYEIR